MGGDSSWEATYGDPLRILPVGGTEVKLTGVPQVQEVRNENCTVKFVMMHRPTHDATADKNAEYPFAWHLSGKKRLWELRLQLRFQRPPSANMFVGIELDKYLKVSGIAKQAQKALVRACKGIVGECYHSIGDDPAQVQGELEAPSFVMPLWAFDQFHAAEAGQEPSLTGDLSRVGLVRSEVGVSKYTSGVKWAMQRFSTDKVYTFCLWGISRFFDVIKWEVVGGLLPGVKLDFNKLCGAPPVQVTLYELEMGGGDKRHLASRKRLYFRSAIWSALRPPGPGSGSSPADQDDDVALSKLMEASDFLADSDDEKDQGPDLGVDLLGFGASDSPATAAPAPAAQPAQPAQNVDLLDLLG